MRIEPYLTFKGDCEAAFRFYARCFGGRLGPMFPYGGSSLTELAPPDWQDKIMHGSVELGDRVLMGADTAPDRYEEPRGFTLSIQIASAPEAERIFRVLAEGGKVVMPLEKTFWAERFGVLVDRFGIPWQINCEGPALPAWPEA